MKVRAQSVSNKIECSPNRFAKPFVGFKKKAFQDKLVNAGVCTLTALCHLNNFKSIVPSKQFQNPCTDIKRM